MEKGKGTFKIRDNRIYVHGTVNGKFYRKSTGKRVSPANKIWIKKADPLKVLADILNVDTNQKGEKNIEEVALEFIDLKNRINTVTEANKQDIKSSIEKNILPLFGSRKFEDITVADISIWIQDLQQRYSNSRVKSNRNLFKSIFEYAQNDLRIVDYNPFISKAVKNIKLTVKVSEEVYTTEEIKNMFENVSGWLKVYLDLSFKYGLRPGELIALKFEDIDFEKNLLHIQRFRNSDKLIIDKTDIDKIPKNKKHFRTISLYESTVELIKAYNLFTDNKEWLFTTTYNKPFVESRSILKYHLEPLLKELNIKNKKLYATRRAFASIYSANNSSLSDLQKIMGHSEGSAITEKHYIKAASEVLSTEELKHKATQKEAIFNQVIFQE